MELEVRNLAICKSLSVYTMPAPSLKTLIKVTYLVLPIFGFLFVFSLYRSVKSQHFLTVSICKLYLEREFVFKKKIWIRLCASPIHPSLFAVHTEHTHTNRNYHIPANAAFSLKVSDARADSTMLPVAGICTFNPIHLILDGSVAGSSEASAYSLDHDGESDFGSPWSYGTHCVSKNTEICKSQVLLKQNTWQA